MDHLLLDLHSTTFKAKHIPAGMQSVSLFAKGKKQLKQALAFAAKHAAAEVYEARKPASALISELKNLLQSDYAVRAVLVSERKKVRQAVAALQKVYPDAELACWRKLGKKQRKKLKKYYSSQEITDTPAVIPLPPPSETAVPMLERKTEWPPLPVCADEVTAPPAVVLPSAADKGCPTFQAAAAFIRRNRPKKKSDLGKALSERLNLEPLAVERLLAQLAEAGHIRVDAAENVRYR